MALPKFVPVALAVAAVLALSSEGGPGPLNPIVGGWVGQMLLHQVVTSEGDVEEDSLHVQPLELAFATNHFADVAGYAAKWKKIGAKFQSDASKAYDADLETTTMDSQAKGSLKVTEIELYGNQGLGGKLAPQQKYQVMGVNVVVQAKAPLFCQLDI